MVDGEKAKHPKAEAGAQKTKMPKGGRKGGAIFPRLGLKQALEYSKKLVSKTAVAAQPAATVLAGVFNNAGPEGKVRLSALKQFGLLEGTPAAYKATQLARDIEAAADETERKPLLQRAMLAPKVYRELVNTYQGDQASKAKIKGRVQQLHVHPDLSEACADLFVASTVTAMLGTSDGDGVRLDATSANQTETPEGEETEVDVSLPGDHLDSDSALGAKDGQGSTAAALSKIGDQSDEGKLPAPRPRTAADVTVNLAVDSSLDGDKLERQLALLRRYGLI
jgi:hypothetical protein